MGNCCCSPKFYEIKSFFSNMYITIIPHSLFMKIIYLRWQNGIEENNWNFIVDKILSKDIKYRKQVNEYSTFWMKAKKDYRTSILILAILILSFDGEVNTRESFRKYFLQFIKFTCIYKPASSSLRYDSSEKQLISIFLLKEVMICYISLISYECVMTEDYIHVEKNIMDELKNCFTKKNIEAYVNDLLRNLSIGKEMNLTDLSRDIDFDEFIDKIYEAHLKDDISLRENLLKAKSENSKDEAADN